MDWFILLVSIHLQCLKGFDETFKYERLHMFGLGRPIVNLRRDNLYAYPEELSTKVQAYVKSPYNNIYQGSRSKRDKRVFNKRFYYPPLPRGHHVYCEGVFDCITNATYPDGWVDCRVSSTVQLPASTAETNSSSDDSWLRIELTHVSIETNGSIPSILRGGVGYKHFSVVIKANYGEELSGRVRAYCMKSLQDK